jgi:hypothetical protein
LAAAAGVAGVGRAGQGFQGGQEGLAGLGFQQPIDRHHPLPGGGQPQPPPLVAPLPLPLGTIRVGDQQQMAQDPPQPPWVQPSGRLDQDRFGLGGHMLGQVVGAVGHHPGMRDRDRPLAQGLGGGGQRATEQGPGAPDRAGRGARAQPQPVPEPAGG